MLILLGIVICTFVLCFTISHIFLSVFVYENKKELKNFKSDIFSYIFGMSNILLILIICQIAEIDDFQIRNITWILFLWFFIAIMFYIIPYSFLYLAICGENSTTGVSAYFKRLLLIVLYLVYLVSANKFLFFMKKEEDRVSFLLFYIIPRCMMEYLSIVGILLSAILSGYGGTHCILNYLVYPVFCKDSLENSVKKSKEKKEFISEEISMKENELYAINRENEEAINIGNGTSNHHSLLGTMKGMYNFVIGRDNKKDIKEEIEELKVLYNDMEMQIKLVKEKTILFRNNFVSVARYIFHTITGKILASYCIYRIVMTVKNLLFQNYSDINVMLREELLNIVDFSLNVVFALLKVDVETIYYTVIEQYFGLLIVGSIIIVNIRSFLNTILFIYTKTIKNYNTKLNKKVQLLFLSYFVGLFYVTSSIFLIFNLPITYRYD